MFENNKTWQRYSPPKRQIIRAHLGYVTNNDHDEKADRRMTRLAIAAAVVLHGGLFFVSFSGSGEAPDFVSPDRPVYVLKQVRFSPPPPSSQTKVTKPKTRRTAIPVPDLTPDDPEPIPEDLFPPHDIEVDELAIYIPDAAPTPGAGVGGDTPFQVGGDIVAPVKVFSPTPAYTEEARMGRIQGVVILQAIIDVLGNVEQIEILKGLPSGLGEMAAQTAKQWRFRPATRNGKPVPVYFNLTIRFSLQ